jgi:hypothetical protein
MNERQIIKPDNEIVDGSQTPVKELIELPEITNMTSSASETLKFSGIDVNFVFNNKERCNFSREQLESLLLGVSKTIETINAAKKYPETQFGFEVELESDAGEDDIRKVAIELMRSDNYNPSKGYSGDGPFGDQVYINSFGFEEYRNKVSQNDLIVKARAKVDLYVGEGKEPTARFLQLDGGHLYVYAPFTSIKGVPIEEVSLDDLVKVMGRLRVVSGPKIRPIE